MISPEAAKAVMAGEAWGAMTVTLASAARMDSILDSARLPAPMMRQGRLVSLRKMGKRDIVVSLRLRRVSVGSRE